VYPYIATVGPPLSDVRFAPQQHGAVYKLSYDLVKDFEPVALLTIAPMWILGKATLPPNNIKELIAWLRANGDTASAAAIGMGSGVASLRPLLPEPHRHAILVRALPWCCPSKPGLNCRADRFVLSRGFKFPPAGASHLSLVQMVDRPTQEAKASAIALLGWT
jgi:hypothetical protein